MELSQFPAYYFAHISHVLITAKANSCFRYVGPTNWWGICTLGRIPGRLHKPSLALREPLKMSQLHRPRGCLLQVMKSNSVIE